MAEHDKMLGSFELITPLTNQDSGFSVWGFARRSGMDYFVKQHLKPIYPAGDTVLSQERIQRKIVQCKKFEQEKTKLYQALNEHSDGNAVRIQEFFRVGSHYYLATNKINGIHLEIEEIANMQWEKKRFLCATISHAVASFHEGGVVHADLKHTNIMFVNGRTGNLIAKVIDFDSSFLETAPPNPGEEIVGDQVYFSPEACRSIWGEAMPLTCKMDIFSLGILFHQYLIGTLPSYSDKFYYPGEAVANGEILQVSEYISEPYRALVQNMLEADPEKRPSADQVFCVFSKTESGAPVQNFDHQFFAPGDL